ncbi:MAG: HNH endonuclease family protein [Pyrinomonadaceae bacterium]
MSTIDYEHHTKTVHDLISLFKNKHLNLNPGFQRSSVWGESNRRKLIDSILLRYPLPALFFYRRQHDGEIIYDVIDGKQRIESILMFTGVMRGHRFWTRAKLSNEENPDWLDWNTIKRKKLQYRITNYKLQIIEVTGDQSDIEELFVRINSTGKPLTPAEKQNAKYYRSDFLKEAARLAKRFENYHRENGIVSAAQASRRKHVELTCELMVAAHTQDVTNKKAALDKVMNADAIRGRELTKARQITHTGLNRLKQVFPELRHTRFNKISDFYSLAVLFQKFEREGLVLIDRQRNRLAQDILATFSTGVDQVRRLRDDVEGVQPGQEFYRDYLLTVLEGTDEISQRRKREQILRGLLESLFLRKDSARLFSPEQRRILWNMTAAPKCVECKTPLTWDNFTIDHKIPWSKGGKTELGNADLMCRRHNSIKRNR